MKKKSKLILIIIIALLVIGIGAGVTCVLVQKNNKQTVNVAFYGLEEKNVEILSKYLQTISDEEGNPYKYNFITLDADKALLGQMKRKFDVVYTYIGKNAQQAASYVKKGNHESVGIRDDILKESTISVRQRAGRNSADKYSIVPLLMDYYEIDIDRSILFDLGLKTIVSWTDIENYVVKARDKYSYTFFFNAVDPREFLGTIGALTEALSGKAAYDAVVKEISAVAYKDGSKTVNLTRNDYEVAISKLADERGAPLYEATHLLARWKNNKLLHSEAYNINRNDLLNFTDIGEAPCNFQTFSVRRKIGHKMTNNISSIYYPSERDPATRYFTAPVIAAIPLKDKANVKQGIELLLTDSIQGKLADDTGLVPVLANCHVPDHQADDIRYWIAATNAPLVPLGDAIFCESSGMEVFSDALTGYIKSLSMIEN